MSNYGKHIREPQPKRNGAGPEIDALALAARMGYFVQKTRLGERRSYALLKDGMIVLRDCRMHEVRSYLEDVQKTK